MPKGFFQVMGGSLLVAGTSIGGGMLALPVVMSLGGFFPGVLIDILCWLLMMSTGLLFVELALKLEGEPNIISMAKATLGLPGKIVTWVLYLFLFYSLTTAYIAGGGELFSALFSMSRELSIICFVAVFGTVVYFGAKCVDRVNIVMILGLALSYLFFVITGISDINLSNLLYRDWKFSLLAVPIIFTSFSFQGLVPSLCTYLKRNIAWIRFSIIFGSLIPLVVYIVWQALVFGLVPLYGSDGLYNAFTKGFSVIIPLQVVLKNPWLSQASLFFAFFALVTSFLGVTLGLFDFFADGLQLKKNHQGKVLITVLVFVFPCILAYWDTHIFISALKYAGGYGCAILLGLLPILMVWISRYVKKIDGGSYRLWGGKPLLVVLALLIFFEVGNQLFQDFLFGVDHLVIEEVNLDFNTN
jgi:tyrosine-specific transport protein